MQRILTFMGITLAIAAILLITKTMSSIGHAQSLQISAEDYANGSKRFAAVSRKVSPALKAAFQEQGLEWGAPIFIRAFKEERTLELWVKKNEKFVHFRSYPIAAASGKLGPKRREGDRQVPEGFYFVKPSQMNPRSNFHLAFNIGYPNSYDKAHGRTGSFIMVHGSDVSIGCLAMTDEKIEEIYTLADAAHQGGQAFFRIHIFPFHLKGPALAQQSAHPEHPFWKNLQTGYQFFEDQQRPPNVTVKNKYYHFE